MGRQLTITQALVELKLYDKKIKDAICDASFAGAAKASSDQIGDMKKDNFIIKAKASYQSITDMISNRARLKSAIAMSNAVTEVDINGTKMSVAAAIELKSSIQYQQMLLTKLQKDSSTASNIILDKNIEVEKQSAKLIELMVGKDKTPTTDEQKAVSESYIANNKWEIIDPLNIYKCIQDLQENIDGFLSNVDVALSVSNAVTIIEV